MSEPISKDLFLAILALDAYNRGYGIGISDGHQTFPAAEHCCAGVLHDGLGVNKTHLGLAGRDHDRLGIGRIIFLALHEGAHILRCNQPHLVVKRFHVTRPIVSAHTGFKDDQAWLLLRHKRTELLSP